MSNEVVVSIFNACSPSSTSCPSSGKDSPFESSHGYPLHQKLTLLACKLSGFHYKVKTKQTIQDLFGTMVQVFNWRGLCSLGTNCDWCYLVFNWSISTWYLIQLLNTSRITLTSVVILPNNTPAGGHSSVVESLSLKRLSWKLTTLLMLLWARIEAIYMYARQKVHDSYRIKLLIFYTQTC